MTGEHWKRRKTFAVTQVAPQCSLSRSRGRFPAKAGILTEWRCVQWQCDLSYLPRREAFACGLWPRLFGRIVGSDG